MPHPKTWWCNAVGCNAPPQGQVSWGRLQLSQPNKTFAISLSFCTDASIDGEVSLASSCEKNAVIFAYKVMLRLFSNRVSNFLEICWIKKHTHVRLCVHELYIALQIYRKIPNISPGLIEVRKHFLVGLYSGAYIRRGLYSEGLLG